MEDLRKLENSELVDLLTKVTDRYYKVNTNGGDKKECDQCKTTIKEIQTEIERRMKEKNSGSDP